MLHKFFLYKTFLRILGILFIFLGIYEVYLSLRVFIHPQILSVALYVILSSPFGMSSPYYLGALSFIGIGIFCLGLSSMRVTLAYWCLQVAAWFVGINVWYQFNGNFAHTSVIPPFAILIAIPNDPWPQLIVTLSISLILFAFYIPITRIISKLYEQGDAFVVLHSPDEQ